jgi:hypothetical protein
MNITSVNPTCKLKLDIDLDKINSIFKNLVKKVEIAGVIHCDKNDNVVNISTKDGESNSVYTPNDVINLHSHPISAYNEGKCVWGWPSGEDIRESIKFALSGNKAHLVFTVEGLYTIQVSPCKIAKMKKLLTKEERGILIFMIEEYFKTTHNFRGTDEVNSLSKGNIFITPYSFVDFANTFDLNNLLSAHKNKHHTVPFISISKTGHTGIHSEENNNIIKYAGISDQGFSKIPNGGFPEVDDKSFVTSPLKNYLTTEDLEDLRSISEFGVESSIPKYKITQLIEKLTQICHKFNNTKCNTVWNNNPNAWFFVNFFPSEYYIKKGYLRNNKFVVPDKKLAKMMYLNHKPFIRIFSDKNQGCTVNAIKEKSNFK